jgi:(1->4)-alpha-D-glucan 1-alpha-D-glucosylmutase
MNVARIPAATYRLQFNSRFGFSDARALIPYLCDLGITDVYASPLLKARKGSDHGYDITEPALLNPELGTEADFAALVETLRGHNMGLLLDIVPNHMAASSENPWWRDVLETGPDSRFASFFDIDWHPSKAGLAGKVLLPLLGTRYGRALEDQELVVTLREDGLWIRYHDDLFPLNPESYVQVLGRGLAELRAAVGTEDPVFLEVSRLIDTFENLSGEGHKSAETFGQAKETLWRLYDSDSGVRAVIAKSIDTLNGKKGDAGSFQELDQVLASQSYRLAFWRAANREINYRRFFDVSELVAIRVEEEAVFAAVHKRVAEMAKTRQITGLRVDHVDGLYDPLGYLSRLQECVCGAGVEPGFYVVVEKILGSDEDLPAEWPVSGTTGYDFQNAVNQLFVDRRGATTLNQIYTRLTGSEADFSTVLYAQKRRVLLELFAGEVRALALQLSPLAEYDRYARDLTLSELEEAIIEVTTCFPFYRSYIRTFEVPERDRTLIRNAVAEAKRRNPAAGPACEFLERMLLMEFPPRFPTVQQEVLLHFVMRWQQLSGPVMAKGFEDTALYVFNRLISLNIVGGDPETTGVPAADFHRFNQARQKRWPNTMNTTSTHDAKRSEDVQARINVLSEIPDIWEMRLDRWRKWNEPQKPLVNDLPVPDGNTELLLYQTLIGAWPLRTEKLPAFKERLQAYVIKSAREAKIYTNWLSPDEEYEKALTGFAASILDPAANNRFLEDFLVFQKIIAHYGALNSLSQLLLKITSPGLPDFYQGMELWNFSLVDPDNRRPVDFQKRAELLRALRNQEERGQLEVAHDLLRSWEDGRIKLYVTYKGLLFRRTHRELFLAGEYLPVRASGAQSEHVCAFARRLGETWSLVVVPRLLARLQRATGTLLIDTVPLSEPPFVIPPLGKTVWGHSVLLLPRDAPSRWHNTLTGENLTTLTSTEKTEGKTLALAAVFGQFPVALFSGNSPQRVT